MDRKAVNMPGKILCVAMLLSLLPAWETATSAQATPKSSPSPPKESPFTDKVASQLLEQIATGLASRNQARLLGAFDLLKMTEGPLFRQQIASFLAQTDSIRMHYNLVEAGMEGGRGIVRGIVSVDIEMEADSRDANTLPVRKQARLRLIADNSNGAWKFVDVEPRNFFSLQP
jgi:hypothetical protein